jgi:SAM-dependent methyltransferase
MAGHGEDADQKGGANHPVKVEEVVEEDWSNYGTVESTASCMTGYSNFQRVTLELMPKAEDQVGNSIMRCPLHLDCIENLTLIDIMNLYNGVEDATGNKVWMGARLFIEAFAVIRLEYAGVNNSDPIIASHVEVLHNWRRRLFNGKRIMELGCGTGASGLSLLRVLHYADADQQRNENSKMLQESRIHVPRPRSVALTDADPNALKLCRQNFELNFSNSEECASKNGGLEPPHGSFGKDTVIEELIWGAQHVPDGYKGTIDTVLATDVLYDLSALQPLVESASALLKPGGYFVLSHVPRAAVDGALVGQAPVLEDLICRASAKVGFKLEPFWAECKGEEISHESIMRPLDIISNDQTSTAKVDNLLDEMNEAGAAILLFKKG